jgi:invasion protein IalB
MGCVAQTPLLPDIIAAMKKTDAGSLELHTIRKQVIKVPISFKGFTAALESLSKG